MNTLFSFDPKHLPMVIIGFFFILFSIYTFEILRKNTASLILVFIAGLFICSFVALLDPFLNTWDEQFHALVAKNLLRHPLLPTLLDKPVIPYDYTAWTNNHVWLHKQPLFLWQIALSLKLFGMNELAVRIPSILMMSVLPLFIYRIGKISINERVGYYAALLFCTSNFVHELVSGFPASDHNDIAFLFYITSSIWAWVEYQQSKNKYWLILIGVFSGCAVLTKWLVGLLVFAGWGISIISSREQRLSIKSYTHILLSFMVCLLIFIPWQLYIIHTFPLESAQEYSLNAKHYTSVIEGHGGDRWYYYDNIRKVYGGGQLVPFVLLLSLLFFYRSIKRGTFKIAFFIILLVVYAFFSLAATKMIGFCFIVSPLIFLSIASMIDVFLGFIKGKIIKKTSLQYIFTFSLLSLIAWANFDLHNIACKHTLLKPNETDKRWEKIDDVLFIKSLRDKVLSKNYVLFNCKQHRNGLVMFYTDFTAYDIPLNYNNYRSLKARGVNLAIIDDNKLPDYILNDKSIIKIKARDSTWINNGIKISDN